MIKINPTKLIEKKREIALLLSILVFSCIIRVPFLHEPLDRDEGTYASVAQEMLRGGIVYKDTIDSKPPLLYCIYSIIFLLFGQTDFALRLFTALYSVGTTIAIFFLSRYLFGNRAALYSALLYGIFSSGPGVSGTIAEGENFFVLPLTGGMLFFLKALRYNNKKWMLLSGIVMGLAVFIKTTAAPTILLYLLLITIRNNPFKDFKTFAVNMAVFLAGPLVLAVLILSYFIYNGTLMDFIHWNIIYNSGNARPLSESWSNLFGRGMQVSSEHLLLWLLSACALITLTFRKRDIVLLTLALWVVTSFLGIAMTGNFWPHYFLQMLPPLSVLSGYAVASVYKREGLKWPRVVLTGALTLLFIWSAYKPVLADYKYYLLYSPQDISKNRYGTSVFNEAKEIGEYIKARTTPDDYIFQWGYEPEIYFYSMRRPASKHLYMQTVFRVSTDPHSGIAGLRDDLFAHRPKYIVIQRWREEWPGYREVAWITIRYYTKETEIGGMAIFRKNDSW